MLAFAVLPIITGLETHDVRHNQPYGVVYSVSKMFMPGPFVGIGQHWSTDWVSGLESCQSSDWNHVGHWAGQSWLVCETALSPYGIILWLTLVSRTAKTPPRYSWPPEALITTATATATACTLGRTLQTVEAAGPVLVLDISRLEA